MMRYIHAKHEILGTCIFMSVIGVCLNGQLDQTFPCGPIIPSDRIIRNRRALNRAI